MKNSHRIFLLAGMCLLISLVFISCNRCEESICQECAAWNEEGETVYYGNLCYVSKSEMRRNERKARKAADDHNGSYECAKIVTTTGCND